MDRCSEKNLSFSTIYFKYFTLSVSNYNWVLVTNQTDEDRSPDIHFLQVKKVSGALKKILDSKSSLYFCIIEKLFPFPLGSNSLQALYFIHSSVLCSEQNEENPVHISKSKIRFFLKDIFASDSLATSFFFLTVHADNWYDGSDLYLKRPIWGLHL